MYIKQFKKYLTMWLGNKHTNQNQVILRADNLKMQQSKRQWNVRGMFMREIAVGQRVERDKCFSYNRECRWCDELLH